MPSACQATYNPLIISCKEGGQEGISLEEVGLRDICKGGGGGVIDFLIWGVPSRSCLLSGLSPS